MLEFHLKEDVKLEDFQVLKTELLFAFTLFKLFADINGLPVKVTSMVSDRENVQAQSRTHEEGRAIDVSSRGWPEYKIREVVEFMLNADQKYEVGAISASDGLRRIIIHHEYKGQGDHFHIQVARDSKLYEELR